MNMRLRMYKVLLFKFKRHLCKGSIKSQCRHLFKCLNKILANLKRKILWAALQLTSIRDPRRIPLSLDNVMLQTQG